MYKFDDFDTQITCEEMYHDLVEAGAVDSNDYEWDPDSDCYIWKGFIYDDER